MNHLAHAHLAAHGDTAFMAGSVLGDFVKGPLNDGDWPAGIAAGIRLHRRIDGFTDRHPVVAECRQRFPVAWRRLAGPALDVLWDHFLSREWAYWHPVALPDFCAQVRAALQAFEQAFPRSAVRFSRWLQEEPVLQSYATADGVEAALQLMQYRLPKSAGLATALRHWLPEHDTWLESRFRLLYADTLSLARNLP